MSREQCLNSIADFFDSGGFAELLAERVQHPTESQNPDREQELRAYLTDSIQPYLEELGFSCRIVANPAEPRAPFLIGQRIEDPELLTVLTYGHGDTVLAMDERWQEGLEPWKLQRFEDRWYGRGVADNKGQHAINFSALAALIKTRGRLGFNCKVILEMGEEIGSPGLHAICTQEKQALAADVFIASDGPRVDPDMPTLFGGSRGVFNFDMRLDLREGEHHSGNWGGLLANPGIILANAIASLIAANGRILLPELKPAGIPEGVRSALRDLHLAAEKQADPNWGEPGLSAAEQVIGWNSLEILALECGHPEAPVHAIPARAWARCHIRFVADTDPDSFLPAIRKHLDAHGFSQVELTGHPLSYGTATRMLPDNPWIQWAMHSVTRTTGKTPAFMPNLGGTLPNDAFSHILGLPTIWFPHSYGGCSQHAPNEHILPSITRESLLMMTGLFWDLAEAPPKP